MIGLLLAAWAVLLLPSVSLGRRAQTSPIDGVRRFEDFMGILANTRATQVPGRWVLVPKDMANAPQRRRNRIIRRRRQAFQRLLFVAGASLLLGLIPPLRVLLLLHLAIDVAIVVYVVQLRRWAREERARAHRPAPAVPEAELHELPIPEIDDDTIGLHDDGFAVSR